MPVWYAITAAVAVALFGLAAWLCLLGARDRVGHRVALGLILGMIGAVWLWVASGGGSGGLAMPRGYVVVVGDDCPDEDVQSIIASLPTDASVSFVRLSPTTSPRSQDGWSSRSSLVANRSELTRLRERSGAVASSEAKWLDKVAEACASAHGERSVLHRLWAKPTVLVVRDTGERWRTLSPRDQDVGAIANKLREADIQVFVTDSRKPSRSGRLSIILDRQPVEAGSLTYRDEKLQINVALPGGSEANFVPAAWVEVVLDEGQVFGGKNAPRSWSAGRFRWLPGDRVHRYEWLLRGPEGGESWVPHVRLSALPAGGDSGALATTLTPGFHKLVVRAALPHSEDKVEVVYEEALYFEVTARQLVVAYPTRPGVKLGTLADLGWHRATFLPDLNAARPRSQEVPPNIRRLLSGDGAKKGLLQAMREHHRARAACDDEGWNVAPPEYFLPLPESSLQDEKTQLTAENARKLGERDRNAYLDWRSKAVPPQKVPDALSRVARWFELLDGGATRTVRPRSLVLVEPTVTELAYLDALLGVGERLRNGLNLAVVGPPPDSTDPSWPEWLTWASSPAPSPLAPDAPLEPWQVFRDFRVYFCADHSGTALRPPTLEDADTPRNYPAIFAQQEVIRRVYAKLGAKTRNPVTDPVRIAPVPAPGGEHTNYYNLALLGWDAPAQGANGITLFPPVTLTYSHKDKPDPKVVSLSTRPTEERFGDRRTVYLDLMLSHSGVRLQALIAPPAHKVEGRDRRATAEVVFDDGSFEPMRAPHLYPNTGVVLFAIKQGQHATTDPWAVPAISRRRFDLPDLASVDHSFNPALPHTVQDLVRMGVTVYVVELEFAGKAEGVIKYNRDELLRKPLPGQKKREWRTSRRL